MSLEKIFNPRSVAVVGASRDPASVGQGVLKNLLKGGFFKCEFNKPFKGKIYAINPKAKKVLGIKCYAKLGDVKDSIDLVVVCVQAKIVPFIMKDCVKKKVGGVIIISAGFAEIGKKGKSLQDEVVKILGKAKIPLIGPNCLGIIRPSANLNATFSRVMPPQGSIAFVTQSGALADSIIDWSVDKNYGFSNIISYGNRADLGVSEFIEWLDKDKQTKVILVYIESVKDGRKFMKVAKKTKKPIIVLKAGKTEAGKKAVSSHTGSLAGSYEIYKAAFNQCEIIEANTIEELFDFGKVLTNQPNCKKNSIAIVSNGGGCAVLCADSCTELGVNLARLKEKTLKKLESGGEMHAAYSRRNPLDLVGDALPRRYEVAINTLLEEDYIHGLIVIQTLQTMTNPVENAKIIIKAHKKYPNKPLICAFLGGRFTKEGKCLLDANKIPVYKDPRKAAVAMRALIPQNMLVTPK